MRVGILTTPFEAPPLKRLYQTARLVQSTEQFVYSGSMGL